MKFTDKYELGETLTTGAVETYIANDKIRGERVLVHIVESAPQKAGQSTMEWVLELFRRVAPEPAGPVLETGKYGETKYVYIVTKPADEAAQNSWVRRYEVQGQETQETRTHPKIVEAIAPPLAPLPPKEPERAPVSVTQLLRDFDSQIKPPAKPKQPAPPQRPVPNLNLSGGQSGLHSAPPWEPLRPQPPVPAKQEEPRAVHLPESFARDAKNAGLPSATSPAASSAAVKDASKPGEFTSFFQGPFRGDGSSDMPSLSSQPIEPPRKTVGEFTAVFGSVGPKQEPLAPALEESGNIPAPSTFTGIFKDMEAAPRNARPSAASGAVTPVPLDPLATAKAKEPSPTPVYAAPPVMPPPKPAVLPPLPTPNSERPAVPKPNSLQGDGATGAFSRPGTVEPPPVMPAVPAGPSPYTQIISRDKLMAESTEATGEEGASPAAAGKIGTPAFPKPPAPPPAPQVKIPTPPKLAAPAVPKAPKLAKGDAPTAPPVPLIPLVITLTVLFSLAVLVVLYFVLKH